MTVIQKYGAWVLLLFHVIGLVLFQIDPSNAELSYLTLYLCAIVLFLAESNVFRAIIPLLVIFVGGYVVEFIGVSTGILFGNYHYGSALGYKFLSIPIVIGMNWFAIVVSSASIARRITRRISIQIILTALLCTLMDFLIEPVAMKYDFWQWQNDIVPVQNYIAWFIFSLVFAAVYLLSSKTRNKPGEILWILWIPFFILLNWL